MILFNPVKQRRPQIKTGTWVFSYTVTGHANTIYSYASCIHDSEVATKYLFII